MNSIVMEAFFDELRKIAADWSLTGPQAIAQYGAAENPVAMHAGPSIQEYLTQQGQHSNSALNQPATGLRAQHEAAGLAREQKMQQMLDSGQWNPKTHTVDMQGNLVPKKPVTVPTSRPEPTAAAAPAPSQDTWVGGKPPPGAAPSAAAQAAAQAPLQQTAAPARAARAVRTTRRAAPAAKGMLGGLSRMSSMGKAGLGAAAIGGAFAAGAAGD